ncbi:MAG: regulatory iron-sulfur-containing complex subunit RicT [Planctomycetota bacterium]
MNQPTPDLVAIVRHGCSTCRTGCSVPDGLDAGRGDDIVVRTDRGTEYALILTDPKPAGEALMPARTEALRMATDEDREKQAEIDHEGKSAEYRFCADRMRHHKLPMQLVKVEKILGGGRLTFYFLAEGRVDFRELVRELASQYRMRIELKQIGARDEAKLLGDVSYCGRELCCSSWIRDMKPVSMRMAKNQKTTLDPSKISGMCGRLLCCLRYEDEVYTELRKDLPKRGKRVKVLSSGQRGLVLNQEVLASRCLILLDQGGTAVIPGSDLEREIPPDQKPAKKPEDQPPEPKP